MSGIRTETPARDTRPAPKPPPSHAGSTVVTCQSNTRKARNATQRKETPAMKLYEYAVVLDEKRDKDDDVTEEAAVVVPVTAVLARDDAQAQLLAARSIPDE